MTSRSGVVAIVPAYEEEQRVGHTVAALLSLAHVDEVIVVDDGSADATAAVARRAGATVVRLRRNSGKGGALTAAVRIVLGRPRRPVAVLFADADLEASARHLAAMVAPVIEGRCDMAIADLPSQRAARGFGVVVGLARLGLRLLTGHTYAEPLSGQRAVSGRALPWLLPFAPGFGSDVAMTIAAAEADLVVREVPVPLTHAPTGRDVGGIIHRGAQARDVLRVLLGTAGRRVAARSRPRRRPRPALRE